MKKQYICQNLVALIAIWVMIGIIPSNIARAASSKSDYLENALDYSKEAINESLKSDSYEENPYYIEGLEKYLNTFNDFYEGLDSGQRVEIIQLEDALKEADISNSLRKKILSAEGKNILEDTDFKRVDEKEDEKIFFSKGNYYEVSSQAKDDIDEIDVILNVLYYLGDLKDNKPNGKGALFVLINSGIRLFYAGNFKEGRADGKGIMFGNDSFGSVLLGQGEFKNNMKDGNFTEYNAFDIQQIYWFYSEKWSEYETSYYNQYSENKKEQILTNLFQKGTVSELMYITQKYEGENFDDFFNVRIKYPVIKPAILYKGKYKNDNYSGKGTLYGRAGTLWYEGEFQEGTYSGKGTLYYALTGIKQYEGQFRNGMIKGKGTLYNTDGTVRKKGKFDEEEVDYENELLEEMGVYENMVEKFNDATLQDIFEK